MAQRNRLILGDRPKGWRTRFGSSEGGGNVLNYRAACEDFTGPGDCDPFTVDKVTVEGGVIRNPFYSYFGPYFEDYVADMLGNPNNLANHATIAEVPSNFAAATTAAARTNPSRPYVDLPAAVFELRDLFTLAKNFDYPKGRSLNAVADANLRLQFGFIPLLSDITKVMTFADHIDGRMAEITRLVSQKGLRRTKNIGSYSTSWEWDDVPQSADSFILTRFKGSTKVELRVHCRWLPAPEFSLLKDTNDLRRAVKKALLGLTIDKSNLWQVLPWSWLIDWGSNVSEYFAAQRNIIPATLSGVHVMRHSVTEWSCNEYHEGAPKNLTMSPIHVVRDTKTRQASSVAPVAQMPFLSGNQVGILGSLAMTRLKV